MKKRPPMAIKTVPNEPTLSFNIAENVTPNEIIIIPIKMYCLYFIIEMLKDNELDYFLKNEIDDDKVCKLRKKYYNVI